MSISCCSAKIVPRNACVTELDLTTHSLPIGLLIILITYKPRGRSIYQYSNMDPRLSGENCIFLKVSFVLNSQKRLGNKENNIEYRSLSEKSHGLLLSSEKKKN